MNKIYVMYGENAQDMAAMLMHEMKVEEQLDKLGKSEPLIGIKPNLVVSQPSEWGATTSPQLVTGVIKYLKQFGFNNIIIMESAYVGDNTEKAYQVCGYEKISREYGVPLVDLKRDKSQQLVVDGIKINVCQQALDVDYLINIPVLKAHCQTRITCALKNLKGCIPDNEKRRFHSLGLHRPIACLNKALSTDLVLVDGIIGDLTYEGGGNPVRMNRIIAGVDPVLIDTYVADLMGYSAEDIDFIGFAEEMGIGSKDLVRTEVVELNSNSEAIDSSDILAGREVDYLKQWVVDRQACSACYGSLIHALMRLKEKGKLEQLPRNIHLGQGYKDLCERQVGIGRCTNKFKYNVSGCPPTAKKIVDFLENLSTERL